MRRLGWRQWIRKGVSRTIRTAQFWMRRRVLMMVDTLCLLWPANPDLQHVLLVRVDNIGDFVLWLDAARALTDHYRCEGKHVTLLGSTSWAAWAAELGIFDAVIPLEQERYKRDLRYRLRTGRRIRGLGSGIAVHPASTRVVEMGDSILRISGATERLGVARSHEATATDRWYSRLIQTGTTTTGELRRNAAFVSALTNSPCKARVADLRTSVRWERLSELPMSLSRQPYFVLFPGASHPGRKWPVGNFVELARRIHTLAGWSGIVCGGVSDISDAAIIANRAGPWLKSLAGQTDLAQLTGVIAGSLLTISNDTSAIHFAVALGVPSVCILGGGHFGRFVPYDVEMTDGRPLPRVAAQPMACFGCEWKCKFHPPKGQPMPCIEEITVDAVWQQAESLLVHESRLPSRFAVLNLSYHNPTKEEAEAAFVGI